MGFQASPVLASGEQEFGQGDASWNCITCKAVQDRRKRDIKQDKNGHSGEIRNLFSYIVFIICNINNSQHFAMQQSFLSKKLCYTYYCYFPRYTNPNKTPKASKGFSLCITLLQQLETTFSGRAEIRKSFFFSWHFHKTVTLWRTYGLITGLKIDTVWNRLTGSMYSWAV